MTKQAKQKRTKQDNPPWYVAVVAELSRLTGHWKQEATILGILDKETAGQGWDTAAFWRQPHICNRNTYYKWMQHDGRFQEVLSNCRDAVRTYRRTSAIANIDDAMMIIQEASPDAARKLTYLINAEDDGDAIRAAIALLDRASKSTAAKTPDQIIHMPSVGAALARIYGEDGDDDDG